MTWSDRTARRLRRAKRKLISRTVATALVIQLGFGLACAHGQTTPVSAPTAMSAPGSDATPPVSSTYRIGRDDQLDILVFQVPDLTRTVQVDAAGQFNLPLVGRVDAAGHTADEIAAMLTEKLSGRYLKDPQITVIVKQAVSQRVTVDGAVTRPGVYVLTGPTTLLQAVALANGADLRIADLKRVAVFRTVNGQRTGQMFDLGKIQHGKAFDPLVQADDIIVVGMSAPRSFFTFFGSSLNFLALVPLL